MLSDVPRCTAARAAKIEAKTPQAITKEAQINGREVNIIKGFQSRCYKYEICLKLNRDHSFRLDFEKKTIFFCGQSFLGYIGYFF